MEQEPEQNHKKKSRMTTFFKSIDFFSITFQFRVANEEKYSSFFGGVSSLFCIVFIIAYVLKSFFDFVSWSDKKIQFITKYQSGDTMDITHSNFFYSFVFTYTEGFKNLSNPNRKEEELNVLGSKYWDMFDIESNYVVIDLINKNKTKKQILDCNQKVNISDFQDLKGDYEDPRYNEKHLDISNHICFDHEDLSLYGQYTDNYMSYIEIMLKIKNEYYKDVTKIQNILDNVLFKFAFYYSDYIYDVSDIVKPVSKRVESTIYSYLDYNYYERINIFLQKMEYSLDDFVFYKKPNVGEYLKFSYYEKNTAPMPNRLDPNSTFKDRFTYIKYFIRPDMKKTIINVTLMKLPEFLSGVSAISTNLLLIFTIIISFINRFQAKQKIITKIMKFNDVLRKNNKQEIDHLNTKIMLKNDSMDRSYNNFRKNNLYLNKIDKSSGNQTSVIEDKSKIENDEFLNKKNLLDNSTSIIKNISLGYSDRSENKIFENPNSNSNIINNNINNDRNNNKNIVNNTVELHTMKNLENPNISINQENALITKKKGDIITSNNKNQNELNFNTKNIVEPKTLGLYYKDIQNIDQSKKNIDDLKYEKTDACAARGKKKVNYLKITTCEIISNYICCKNIKEKKKIFEIAEKKFDDNIDILTYQRKMFEIDILKFLILDKDLLEIMHFISKPSVCYNRKSKYNDEIYEFFNEDISNKNNFCLSKIKDVFHRIIEEKDQNGHVKERIFKLFENQIQQLA